MYLYIVTQLHGILPWADIKAMDDTGAVMTPFGDVVTVILVVNSNVVRFLGFSTQGVGHVD